MHENDLFLNEWQDAGTATLAEQFGLNPDLFSEIEVLLASYSRDAYCGEAFVLFRQGSTLFEINASHDSTDGMEEQWEPEETLVAALRYRLEKGRLGSGREGVNLFADELGFLLAELEADGFR